MIPTSRTQRPLPSSAKWLTFGVLALFAVPAAAQIPGPPETVIVHPQVHTGGDVDMPQPPRVFLQQAPIGGLPPIPTVDAGLPQPDSRPAIIGDLEVQPLAGAFTFYRNRDQRPPGAQLLHPGEPSVSASRDTWFATGNTYGSVSRDSGMSWTYVNPYTLFPAVDGGVCCDQRVISERLGMLFWFIQYRYSASTGNGGFRLAWARNRDDLRNQTWNSIYLNAASFGFNGNWLDFPDISVSAGHVYIATNVFNASSVYQNSIVMRMPLTQIRQGSAITTSYYRRTGGTNPMGGGASYRFTQAYTGNPTGAMFWASHNNTSSMRIFRWDDGTSGRLADVNRTIPTWTSGTGSSRGPDNRDWLGFDDHRIASGYLSSTANEAAFLWTSNANGGSRPQSYVRVQAFNPTDRNIIATEDVWNTSFDFAYPAIGMNSLGHGAVVMSGGSATTHVTTYAFIADNYTPFFQGATLYAVANGSHGAPSNRWGDYHSVVANPIDPRTFLGTGMHMSGGTTTGNTMHRSMWFGRDDYTPAWATLNVAASGVANVPITVDEMDRNGSRNGTTPFSRSYTPQQGYTLRAPASVTSGGNTYLFRQWNGASGVRTNPIYTVSSIGSGPHTATASYGLQTTVTIDDRNVSTPVPITVSRTDLDNQGNGQTRFTRRYNSTDGSVSFTAPAQVGAQVFRRWYVNNAAQPNGQRTITNSLTSNSVTIEAEYCLYAAGSTLSYGVGCPGSNAQTPLLTTTSSPDIGTQVTQTVARLPGPTPAVMSLGFSRTVWNALPLPFSLGVIGTNPACNVLAAPTLSLPIVIGGNGSGNLTFPLANNPSHIGVSIYTQVIAVDVFVPTRTPIVVSNGLEMRIGGSSLGGQRCP